MSLDPLLDRLLRSDWQDEDPTGPLEDHPRSAILAGLKKRFEQADDGYAFGNGFDICANVLQEDAADWLREVSRGPISNLVLLPYFRALSNCLGDEGFEIAVNKLEGEFPHQVALTAHALLAFDSKERIHDWIEKYVVEHEPAIVTTWGQLAALAGIRWGKIDQWLGQDKRLGLIALDAMHCCYDHDAGEGGWLYTYEPTLGDPDEPNVMADRLKAHAEAYPTPRVASTVDKILTHLE